MASKNEKRTAEIIINGKKAEASINDMVAATSVLNSQLKKLPQGTEEFLKKTKELNGVRDRLKKVNAEVRGTQKATKEAEKGFLGIRNASGLMKKSFDLAVRSLLPLFAFQKITELVQHIFGIESAYTKLRGEIQKTTKLQGDALDEATVKVQALGETFDIETKKITKSANTIAKEFDISVVDALDLVEKGLIAAGDEGEEFLEQAKEYSTQFKAAGFSAEEMGKHLVNALQDGIFNDKGADAVKEFGLRIREQTKTTKDALEGAFGKEFTKELFDNINDGSITTAEALEKVSAKMNDTTIPAKELQTVIADTFGGAGEDAGLRYLQTLTDISGSIEDIVDETNPLIQQQKARLELNKQLAEAQNQFTKELEGSSGYFETLSLQAQVLFYEILGEGIIRGKELLFGLINGFIELYNNSTIFRGSMELIGATFKTAYNAQKLFFEAMVTGFSNTGNLIKAVLTGDFASLNGIVNDFKNELVGNFTEFGSETSEAFSSAWKNTLEADKIEPLQLVNPASLEEQENAVKTTTEKIKDQVRQLTEANEAARKKEMAAMQAIEDLKIELIEDTTEREIAQITLNTQRKIEALTGSENQITEQKILLEQLRTQRLEELKAEQREKEKLAEEERFKLEQEEQAILEEEQKVILEEKFANGLLREQEYQLSLFDLKKQAMQSQLALLVQNNKAETLEAKKLQTQIAHIEKQKADYAIETEGKTQKAKAEIRNTDLSALQGALSASIGFLTEQRDEEGKMTKGAKTLAKANIIFQSGLELQRIWAGASSLGPIAGPIVGGLQSGLALLRTRSNLSKLESTGYAHGGHTGKGLFADNSGHKVAGVVHNDEWVAPKWMNEHPVYANVIGMLETVRTRGFAQGGFTNTPVTASPVPQTSSLPGLDEMINEFRGFREELRNWPKNLNVYNNVGETQEGIKTLNEIRNDGSIS